MTDKQKMEFMAKQFGFCRCKSACQVEQYADPDMQDKPGGRYSVCEVEADKCGIKVPAKEEP